MAEAADSLQVTRWEATASALDDDGDRWINCALNATYCGSCPVPFAKLRYTLAGPDEWPVSESESTIVREGELKDWVAGSELALEDRSCWRSALDTTSIPLVSGSILLFPVEWSSVGSVPCSESERTVYERSRTSGPLEISRWCLGPGIDDDGMFSHALSVCFTNTGDKPLALCMARATVLDRSGAELSDSLLYSEALHAGEARWLITKISLPLPEDPPLPRVLLLKAGATDSPILVALPTQHAEVSADEGGNYRREESAEAEEKGSTGIPEFYEECSVAARLAVTIFGAYDDGWNDQGVPASFEFPDGVLVTYSETMLDDEETFSDEYDEMTGYRLYAPERAQEIFLESQAKDLNSWVYHLTLDFSTHADLSAPEEELTVKIKEFQVGADQIAGSITYGDSIDLDWLGKWIDKVILEDWKVTRL